MSKGFIKTSMWVTIIMVIGYAISFAKEAILANFFGISSDVDAYTIAITIPVTLFAMVSVSIQSIVIPLYSDSLYNQGKEKASADISNLLIVVSIVSVAFIFLCEVGANWIIYLFAPGFSAETHNIAVLLLRLTAPTMLFSALEKVYVGVLNVHHRYIGPSFTVYFLNISLIIAILILHSRLGIVAACIGQLMGGMLSLIFVILLSNKLLPFSIKLSFKDPFIIKAAKQSIPIIWSVSLGEVSAMINRMVASFMFVGSIAALGYASKINSVMLQFFTVAIATIIYPLYAESSAKKDIKQLNSRINFTISAYSMFLVPLMVGIICFKDELITVAFARGAFDKNAVDATKNLLGIYAIGLLFMAMRETITKVFYSLKDTATPAKNATMSICTNIALNLTLPLVMGVNGLAAATSICAIVFSSRLLYQLTKKHNEIKLNDYFRNIPKIIVSAIIMAVVVIAQKYFMPISNSLIQLIVGLIEGGFIYLLCCLLLQTPILRRIANNYVKE